MSEVKPYVPEFCESSGDKWSEMQEDAAAREMLLASNAAEWRWRSRNFAPRPRR